MGSLHTSWTGCFSSLAAAEAEVVPAVEAVTVTSRLDCATPTRWPRFTVAAGMAESVMLPWLLTTASSPGDTEGEPPSVRVTVSLPPLDKASFRTLTDPLPSSPFFPWDTLLPDDVFGKGGGLAGSPSLRELGFDPRPELLEALDSAVRLALLPPRLFILMVSHSYDAQDHWLLTRAPGNRHSSYGPTQLQEVKRKV